MRAIECWRPLAPLVPTGVWPVEGAATGQCLGISAAMASALSQDPGLALGSGLDGQTFA
jgi:hypothetical protein